MIFVITNPFKIARTDICIIRRTCIYTRRIDFLLIHSLEKKSRFNPTFLIRFQISMFLDNKTYNHEVLNINFDSGMEGGISLLAKSFRATCTSK